jgi:hypothetical protein
VAHQNANPRLPPVCLSSARNRGFDPAIPGQIHGDISGTILRLLGSGPVSIQTSVGGCRFRQRWTTGCLTSATFAAPSRLRAVIYFGLRRPLPELPFRRGPSRCSEQDQQGSH